MKIVHKDPCRKLLEKLPKSAIVDLAIEGMRQAEMAHNGRLRRIDVDTAQKYLMPIVQLLNISMPHVKTDVCANGCCPIRRPTKQGKR